MATLELNTHFAPPERASAEVVARQAEEIESLPLVSHVLDALPECVMILNGQRQVVFANRALLESAGLGQRREAHGRRPGEVWRCIHADDETAGCGTSETCSTCGAVQAILKAVAGQKWGEECRISTSNGHKGALDLAVWATPVNMGQGEYIVLAAHDISDRKRRRVLERIFFHDLMNTAGSLRAVSSLLKEDAPDHLMDMLDIIEQASDDLVREIESQKMLLAAENHELRIELNTVASTALLNQIIRRFAGHNVSEGKNIVLSPEAQDFEFETDVAILGRVLGNLLKNALEASSEGQKVTMGCRQNGAALEFTVHNPGEMPKEVKLQVFNRSFSTKDASRGLGTYSVKLLSENYLGGRVSFVSNDLLGTSFTIYLPKSPA